MPVIFIGYRLYFVASVLYVIILNYEVNVIGIILSKKREKECYWNCLQLVRSSVVYNNLFQRYKRLS